MESACSILAFVLRVGRVASHSAAPAVKARPRSIPVFKSFCILELSFRRLLFCKQCLFGFCTGVLGAEQQDRRGYGDG